MYGQIRQMVNQDRRRPIFTKFNSKFLEYKK